MEIGKKIVNISIDRLKAVFEPKEPEDFHTKQTVQERTSEKKNENTFTTNEEDIKRTRSGRRVRFPQKYLS